MARALSSVGADTSSVVQVSYGYGLFTGGLGAHDGAQRVGAMVVPTSGGNTRRQVMMMRDLGSTHLCCTPSYAMYLSEAIEKEGISRMSLSCVWACSGPRPERGHARRAGAPPGHQGQDIYGLTEISGPGVSMQCLNGTGMHIQEDHFYPEIIDPDTLGAPARGRPASWSSPPSARRVSRFCATAPGHHQPDPRALRVRAHDGAHGPHPGPHGRYVDHPRRQRLPQPGGERPAQPGHGAPLPDHRRASTTWTRWRSRWR